MQGKLGALVLDVQKATTSAGVDIHELKQLLILSYPFEEFKEEIRRAQDLTDVFVAVRKLCSPVNLSVLVAIVDRFKLSDALTAIKTYEVEEQIYRKRLLSTTFAQELQKEVELTGRNPTLKRTITLHLNWSSPENFTVKEFEKIVKDVFSDLSKYIHIIKVEAGSIIVTMCAPELVIEALTAMVKTRLPYLFDIGVILLQIGDEVILDKRVEKVTSIENKCLSEDTFFTIFQTVPHQQSQLSNVSKLKKDVNSDGTRDSNEDSPSGLTPTWRDIPPSSADLLIVGSFGEVSNSETIEVAHKLVPTDQEGSNQWMTKEIDLIKEMFRNDSNSERVSVCSDRPGTKHSKTYYVEKIKTFLTACTHDKAVIWYTGHGEKNTGNWCFKDGVITFQDIFGLYMDCFRGKQLIIHSDCSYSGNWIKDCVKTLDDLGIPSCGHHTREQGILLNVFCSCDNDEETTALCYITEATEFDEINNSIVVLVNTKLSSGQTTKLGGFVEIRCSKTATETCEIESMCTWEDRFYNYHLVKVVNNKDEDKEVWYIVLVDEDKIEAFKNIASTRTIDAGDYGTILYSGRGQNPPKDIIRKVYLRFMPYIDPE